MVYYLLKKFTSNQPFVKYDAAILRYMQRANMTAQQYAYDRMAKSCRVADVYEKSALNGVLIEEVGESIHYSLQNYRGTNSQANLLDIAFQNESPLSIQNRSE